MWKGSLTFDQTTRLVRVLILEPMTVSMLLRIDPSGLYVENPRLPVLLVGRTVREKSAAMFREMGISFADAAGNAYIRLDNLLVDVRGRRPAPSSKRSTTDTSAGTSANLFSTGRAQVVAMLLAWPELADGPVREVARAAGVSLGQAHSAQTLLEQTGYLVDRQLRGDRTGELLDLWTASYPQGLGRKLAVASYRSATSVRATHEEVMHQIRSGEAEDLELSGESAPQIGVRQPTALTVYAADWTPRRAVGLRWRAARSESDANVHVRRRFWTRPSERAVAGVPVAPWPIVYADLMATGDPRLAEIAAGWRQHHS